MIKVLIFLSNNKKFISTHSFSFFRIEIEDF